MIKQSYYRIDSMDRIRIWTIRVDEIIPNELYHLITEDGLENGKLKGAVTPISKGLGKKTVYEQAVADAQTEIATKLKRGYGQDKNNLKKKGDTATIKDPMKAETLKLVPANDKEAKKTYTVKKTGHEGKKVRYDVKLDGWRFRLKITKTEEIFYTSSGDITLPFPHIAAAARKAFDKNIGYWEKKYGVTEHILDGELYTHGLNVIRDAKDKIIGYFFKKNTSGFAAAASAGASGKNKTSQSELTPIQKELRDLMQFQLFDVVLTEGLDGSPVLDDTRLKVIANYFDGKDIVEVTHFEDTFTEDNVKKYMKTVLDLGYEGLMVKVPGHPYVHERSKMIFKHKPLLDDDFEITGFLESLTGNTLGSIEFKMPGTNKIFSATPKDDWGTDAMKKIIWDNQSDYKGKFATVEFLEYTPDGVPRHGRVKGFRKGKSKD